MHVSRFNFASLSGLEISYDEMIPTEQSIRLFGFMNLLKQSIFGPNQSTLTRKSSIQDLQ